MYSEKVYNKFIDVQLYFCTELLNVLTCLTLHECMYANCAWKTKGAQMLTHFITHSNLVDENSKKSGH